MNRLKRILVYIGAGVVVLNQLLEALQNSAPVS